VESFINHSCSPNLFCQKVLYDHDDGRISHNMLFQAKRANDKLGSCSIIEKEWGDKEEKLNNCTKSLKHNLRNKI
jgi:hypothetical protein